MIVESKDICATKMDMTNTLQLHVMFYKILIFFTSTMIDDLVETFVHRTFTSKEERW